MAANVYIAKADLTSYVDIGELAQVSAAHDVAPSDIEADLAAELAGTNTGNTEAQAAEAHIEAAVESANAIVDGYLGGRYTLPLAEVPGVLQLHASRIARYELHDQHAPDEVRRRYDDAIRYLEKVARGTVTITTDSGTVAGTGARSQYSAPTRVFDTDESEGARLSDFVGAL